MLSQKKINDFVAANNNNMLLALLREYKQMICVQNLVLKFQAVRQKTAKNFGGYLCRIL